MKNTNTIIIKIICRFAKNKTRIQLIIDSKLEEEKTIKTKKNMKKIRIHTPPLDAGAERVKPNGLAVKFRDN